MFPIADRLVVFEGNDFGVTDLFLQEPITRLGTETLFTVWPSATPGRVWGLSSSASGGAIVARELTLDGAVTAEVELPASPLGLVGSDFVVARGGRIYLIGTTNTPREYAVGDAITAANGVVV